jgi:hypothetical protein
MKWIVDMEAFQINGKWYPKEIAILNTITLNCTCLTIKCDVSYRSLEPFAMPMVRYQFSRHGIFWDDGEYSLSEAKQNITNLVNMDVDKVFVKGYQKETFFASWFPRVYGIDAPALKDLNKCPNQVCDKNHHFNCARRKCFELLPYVFK